MTKNIEDSEDEYKPVKSESVLPTKTVGIECLKESNPETMSPHRNIFKWFARRPTTATRLAILSSVLPQEISNEELLNIMCVGPENKTNKNTSEYILEKYKSKNDRNGTIEEHFGYQYPHRKVPSEHELQNLHEQLKSYWDGNLPVVIDPTAGGGTIPLESLRYGLPTISNELNPVAWLLNKVILEYGVTVGSVDSEVRHWMSKIEEQVRDDLTEFFPSRGGVQPSHYYRAYSILCPSCGERFPLSTRWLFNTRSNSAIYPRYTADGLKFDVIDYTKKETRENYDPNEGTVSGSEAECPHCNVVTQRPKLLELFNNKEFKFEVCGVRYEEKIDGSKYHAPTQADYEAIDKAEKRVGSDLKLSTILSINRFEGHWDGAVPYGVKQWRDMYSPRQLITHSSYLEAFGSVKPEIQSQYDESKSELILILLSFIPIKLITRNSRLNPFRPDYGSPSDLLGDNNFSFKWYFGESNLMTGTYSYQSEADNILNSYENTVNYVEHLDKPASVHQGDASDLPVDTGSVQSVVIDPPYGDNVIYSEVADVFYVWFREYIGDIFVDEFAEPETNKRDEAVENPAFVNPKENQSISDAARKQYEKKMNEIFDESHRILERGGVLTLFFTDKEVGAWDSLTMAIIRSGFVISATHTITSELPNRIGVQNNASADSTLLLVCRKPKQESNNPSPTLWRNVKEKTKIVARERAEELLDSQHNLTKTDMIISAFGPTLRVFTQESPIVDDKDNLVRPKEALAEARTAVTEILVERELSDGLDDVDALTKWYILSWLVYESESIPYDEARQLGLGVGVEIDSIKQDTKIWGQSKDTLLLKGQSDRVRDHTALESGEKRRKRAYPVNPQDRSFDYNIDAVHAALNVLDTKGGDFTWNWLKDRGLHNSPWFTRTIKSLIQVLPESHPDYDLLINLVSGETGELLDVDIGVLTNHNSDSNSRTTLQDFE